MAPDVVNSDSTGTNMLGRNNVFVASAMNTANTFAASTTAAPTLTVSFAAHNGEVVTMDLSEIKPSPIWEAASAIRSDDIIAPGNGSANAPKVEDARHVPQITVSATATAKVPVSRGRATLRVRLESSSLPGASATPTRGPLTTEQDKDPRYCSSCIQAEVNKRMNALLEMVRTTNTTLSNASASGFPQMAALAHTAEGRKPVYTIRTESVTLSPEYSYDNNTRFLTGYAAGNAVIVEADATVIGKLVDGAVRAGATDVASVELVPSDEDLRNAKNELEERAVKLALGRARSLLNAAGLTKKAPVLSVNVNSSSSTPHSSFGLSGGMVMRSAMVMAADSKESSTPISSEDADVSANATVAVSLQGEGGLVLVV